MKNLILPLILVLPFAAFAGPARDGGGSISTADVMTLKILAEVEASSQSIVIDKRSLDMVMYCQYFWKSFDF